MGAAEALDREGGLRNANMRDVFSISNVSFLQCGQNHGRDNAQSAGRERHVCRDLLAGIKSSGKIHFADGHVRLHGGQIKGAVLLQDAA